MSSKRKKIRQAVKSALDGKLPLNTKVFSNRLGAYFQTELPAVSIFMRSETAEPRDLSSGTYQRTLQLSIEITDEALEGLDDNLDQIAAKIEELVTADPSFQGEVLGSVLTGSEMELSADSTTPVGTLTLNYELKYIG